MKRYFTLIIIMLLSLCVKAQLEVQPGSFKEVPGFVTINHDNSVGDTPHNEIYVDGKYLILPEQTRGKDITKVCLPDWIFNHADDCFVGVSLPLHDATLAEEQALLFAGMLASRNDGVTYRSISEYYEKTIDDIKTETHKTLDKSSVIYSVPAEYQVVERKILPDGCLALLVKFSFDGEFKKVKYLRDRYSHLCYKNDSLLTEKGSRIDMLVSENIIIENNCDYDSVSISCQDINGLEEDYVCGIRVPGSYQYVSGNDKYLYSGNYMPCDTVMHYDTPVIGNFGLSLWHALVSSEIEMAIMCSADVSSSAAMTKESYNCEILNKKISFEMGGLNNNYETIITKYDFQFKNEESDEIIDVIKKDKTY